jgi:hypothetical protein
MRRDRIGIAMDAGKRWAEQQIKNGIEITPASAEEAAHEKFTHAGSQHLFLCSALDVALLNEAVEADANQSQSHRWHRRAGTAYPCESSTQIYVAVWPDGKSRAWTVLRQR